MLDCGGIDFLDRQTADMAKELFGTDGMRGVPGTPPLDDATLFATGRAVGEYLNKEFSLAHALIGMDTRESGPHIAQLLTAGLHAGGASAEFAGVITTPGVACLVRENDYQAGVVISASHNPYHDNGVKLFSHAGMKFPDAVEEKLETEILRLRGAAAPPAARPPLVANHALHVEYLDFLRGRVIEEQILPACAWCWTARMGLHFSWDRNSFAAWAPMWWRWVCSRTGEISTQAADRCIWKDCRSAC